MEPRLEILPESQRNLWPLLHVIPPTFVLYGGTGIALRFGHRISVDFDFFSSAPCDGDTLLALPLFKECELLNRTPGSITLLVNAPEPVRFQFFWDLPLSRAGTPVQLDPPGILLASPLDLMATKLKVLQDRAEKKDYLDLAQFLLHGYDLAHGLAAAVVVYRNRFNPAISLRAAVSFTDGDLPALPKSCCRVLEQAVATFWKSNQELPQMTAASPRLHLAD